MVNETMIKYKKLHPNAIAPKHQNLFAAGADLYACCDNEINIAPGDSIAVKTGIAMEMSNDCVGLVFARSGIACKQGLAPANKVGVVDPDYRGEIIVFLHNHSNEYRTIHHGDRIAQMVFIPRCYAHFAEVDELSSTDRGEGGFGSTGK